MKNKVIQTENLTKKFGTLLAFLKKYNVEYDERYLWD